MTYDVFDENETWRGKKSAGVEEGAENSIEPDFAVASTIGRDHTSVFRRASCVYCPSYSLTMGLQPTGNGMFI